MGDGLQRRDFTFVGDVVRANVMAAMNLEVNGTFNIGCGKNYNMLEVANLVAPNHPVTHIPARQGEYRATLADTSRARNELGWFPSVSLENGLKILDLFESRQWRSGIITP